jgi:hypothetical protein
MGTESEPRPLRIEPHRERMGTQWGFGPLTIEQTTEDVAGDPPLGREQASEGDGDLATGRRLRHRAEIRVKGRRHGPRREPDERSGRPRTRAPHEEARSE